MEPFVSALPENSGWGADLAEGTCPAEKSQCTQGHQQAGHTAHGNRSQFKEVMANASIPPKGIELNIYMSVLLSWKRSIEHTLFFLCVKWTQNASVCAKVRICCVTTASLPVPQVISSKDILTFLSGLLSVFTSHFCDCWGRPAVCWCSLTSAGHLFLSLYNVSFLLLLWPWSSFLRLPTSKGSQKEPLFSPNFPILPVAKKQKQQCIII